MAFDFPASPTDGTVFTPAGGPSYVFSNGVWKLSLGTGNPFNTADTRNRMVNPAMQISQENGDTEAGTVGYFPADQWLTSFSGALNGKALGVRVALTTPNGSKYRVRLRSSVIAVPASNEYVAFIQDIEGINIVDLQWGTVNAKPVVLRFGFRGPAATYSAALRSGALDRSYVANFTITAGQANADTEQVFVIPGATAGTFANDNTRGLTLWVTLTCGAALQTAPGIWTAGNFIAGTGISNTFMNVVNNAAYLFDVGLYLDPSGTGLAPAWQMPNEAQELMACKRYWCVDFEQFSGSTVSGVGYRSNFSGTFQVPMRTTPAISLTDQGISSQFPATVGGTAVLGNAVYESRVANLTGNNGLFRSLFNANARM